MYRVRYTSPCVFLPYHFGLSFFFFLYMYPFFFFYFIFSGLRTFFRQQKCVVEPRQALMCMRTHNEEKEKNKLNVTQPKNTLIYIYIYMLSLKKGRH